MVKALPRVARLSVTVVVTAVLLVTGFVVLRSVFHLDDEVQAQRSALSRFDGTMQAWQPGTDPAPVVRAARALAATDVAGEASLRQVTDDWAAAPRDRTRLDRLRAEDRQLQTSVAEAEAATNTRVELSLLCLLLVVSVGWCARFRRLAHHHRRLEQAITEGRTLDEGERRLIALVRNSAELVVVLEPDTTVSFASPSSTSVVGRDPEELMGRRFVDLLVPSEVPIFAGLFQIARDYEQAVVLHVPHPEGRELVLEGTLTNLVSDPSVRGWVLTVRDVTDRELLQRRLSHLGFHDALTGLANRQLFADRLGHALRSRDRALEPVAVLVIDLDDFQQVNDTAGHSAGDDVLVAVAERISATVRQGDTVGRLGADEFAVLMENADAVTARSTADRLLGALAEAVPGMPLETALRASIGVAQAQPGQSDPEVALRNADVAMHWAKQRGKGRVAVYEPGLHADTLDRLVLRGDLQRAIREDQLVMHFQPTVHLVGRRLAGFEALVRWQHPTRGLMFPDEFLPVAVESGLVTPMGSWVLQESCRAAASLQTATRRPSVAVNVVAQQLALPGFTDEVLDVLRTTGLAANRLVLEITEGAVLDDLETACETLSRLREHGVRIAIDDFGTGYSSLSYLSRLPLDILKIDKSFVDAVHRDAQNASVVESIISLGQRLGLVTVAEGVELAEQADWLEEAGCSIGQGFWWSPAVPLDAARDLPVCYDAGAVPA